MVRIAATLARLNSSPVMAKKPMVVITSWVRASSAATLNCHSKRNQM